MFCDDANGLVIDIGQTQTYSGFIGAETPSYTCESCYGMISSKSNNIVAEKKYFSDGNNN